MYDLLHLIEGKWEHAEAIAAPSRRQAMKTLRKGPTTPYRHVPLFDGFDEDGKAKYNPCGKMHGRYKVVRAI